MTTTDSTQTGPPQAGPTQTETTKPASPAPVGLALLRITLGVILLATWRNNVSGDLYTADGLKGFFNWLFDQENGNASSLGAYESILDATIIPAASLVGPLQLVIEFLVGLALLLGVATRAASAAAAFFFLNLLLAYFGGHEWIWTYVILMMSSVAVFLGYGGRALGIDQWLYRTRGESPYGLIW